MTLISSTRCTASQRLPWLGLVLWCVLSCGESDAVAQDWIRPSGLWPSNSLILRGQEPEPSENIKAEHSHADHIETDRDSYTPATTTAGRGRWIAEAAYSFIDNRHTFDSHSLPELLLRYGVSDRVEFRLGWNYEVGGSSSSVSNSNIGIPDEGPKLEREHLLFYGLKVGITEQQDWLPRSALIVQGFTPTGGPDTTTNLGVVYVCGWKLPNEWHLDAAMKYGLATAEHDTFNQWAPSIVLKVPVTERWNAHVEYFGIHTDGSAHDQAAHYVSPGVHYLVTPDFEIGVRLGWGLNDDASKFFTNVGIGRRF